LESADLFQNVTLSHLEGHPSGGRGWETDYYAQ
jgi:hypothetical protein